MHRHTEKIVDISAEINFTTASPAAFSVLKLSFFNHRSDLTLDPGEGVYANPGHVILIALPSQLNSVQITAFRAGGTSCRFLSVFVSLFSDDVATRVV